MTNIDTMKLALDKVADAHRLLRQAISEAEQAEQEPVVIDPNGTIRLLKHPPQREWVRLTDDEINEWTPEIHGVIRAIEAKLKEKNS